MYVKMGLGKTIQTAAFLHCLREYRDVWNPFLIVAPLSTIQHWYREITGWTGKHKEGRSLYMYIYICVWVCVYSSRWAKHGHIYIYICVCVCVCIVKMTSSLISSRSIRQRLFLCVFMLGMNAIVYHGSDWDREMIREHEFFYEKTNSRWVY